MSPSSADGRLEAASRRLVMLGVLTVLFGLGVIAVPVFSSIAVELAVGLGFTAAGLCALIFAFQEGIRLHLASASIGLLQVAVGVLLLANPLDGAMALTLILALALVVEGSTQAIVAVRSRPARGWGWLVVSGLTSIALGTLLLAQFPWSGLWALGLFAGLDLVIAGSVLIRIGNLGRTQSAGPSKAQSDVLSAGYASH